jgi:hypothetical protein
MEKAKRQEKPSNKFLVLIQLTPRQNAGSSDSLNQPRQHSSSQGNQERLNPSAQLFFFLEGAAFMRKRDFSFSMPEVKLKRSQNRSES